MNRIDNANAWEQKYCRLDVKQGGVWSQTLPSFDDHHILADRSIGHAMGPLAALLCAGYSPDSEEYSSVDSLFRHYLIARQLHDDAHDWADDLLRGRANSVGTLVLQRFREKNFDVRAGEAPTIAEIIPDLRKIFWEEIIDDTVGLIASHIAGARTAREKSILLADSDFMENTLRRLESGARRAIKERDEALVFIKDYKGSPPSGIRS
jgi:hypothetical protein